MDPVWKNDDLRLGIKILSPLIWYNGPAEDYLERVPKRNSRIEEGFTTALSDTPGLRIFHLLKNPTEAEQAQLQQCLSAFVDSLVKKTPVLDAFGNRHDAYSVRVFCVASDRPPIEGLMPYVWPCGSPRDFNLPDTKRVARLKSLLPVPISCGWSPDLVQRNVTHDSIAVNLTGLTLVMHTGQDNPISQVAHDEAIRLWIEQRAKFNLFSGVA